MSGEVSRALLGWIAARFPEHLRLRVLWDSYLDLGVTAPRPQWRWDSYPRVECHSSQHGRAAEWCWTA
jgi:hypothetical protein